MPVYRKAKSKWRVRIWTNGKPRDWIVEGTKREAEAFEARKRVEIGTTGTMGDRVAPRFSDFCLGSYAEHAKLRLKGSTWSVRRYHLATLIAFFEATRLTAISTALVDKYAKARHDAGLRPTSVNNELAVLQAVLSFARSRAVPSASPKIEKLTVRTRRHAEAWSTTEMKRLLRTCTEKSPGILPLVVFLANTGCRKGEALALRWNAVDLDRRIIRIWPNEEWQPKDNDAREVPISSALLAVLKKPRASDAWVFPTSTGERYVCWPRKQFDRAVAAAKLTGGPHKLRHTFASHFLAKCPDLPLLARLLGHSDVRVTERVYAHLLPGHRDAARNVVNFAPRAA